MGQVANVALTDTFDTWRIRSNQSFTNLFEVNPSANTLTANSVTGNTVVVLSAITLPAAAINATDVAFLANTNTYISTKLNSSTYTTADVQAKAALANTNTYIATKISSITANTQLSSGVVTHHAVAANAIETDNIANDAITFAKMADSAVHANTINDSAVTYNKLNANTAHKDRDGTFSAAQRGSFTALGVYHGLAGNTVTLSLGTTNHYTLTTNANLTMANPTLTNLTGQGGTLVFTSNGSYTVSWGSYWRFATGTVPTMSTTVGKQDRVDYQVISSNTIHATATIDVLGTA